MDTILSPQVATVLVNGKWQFTVSKSKPGNGENYLII